MKTRRLLVLAIVLMMTDLAFGQEKLEKLFAETTPEQRARYQTEQMAEQLELREEQRQRVLTINLKYTREMEHVFNEGGGKLQRLKRLKAVGQQKDAELKKVLDAEQFAKYERMKEERRDTMKARARESRP